MSKFCGTCGSPLNEGQKFCGKCGGANAASPQMPAENQPYASPAPPAFAPVTQPQPVVASTPARSNSLLKVGIAAVVIIFVGGIAALGAAYYVVHKVKEKVQAAVHQTDPETQSSAASGIAALVQKATDSADSETTATVSKAILVVFLARRTYPAPWASRLFARMHKAPDAATSPKAIRLTWSQNT